MFFVPMFFSYIFSSYNLYASVVVLKLILFFFTLLTAFLLYRITQKVKPSYADAVLIFSLLNPGILYINYIWAQVDILPVFFFTMGYFLLRYVDFGTSSIKRYLIGFFPIIISAFIYRYSLILIPVLIIYESTTLKQKFSALLVAVAESAALFVVELIFFRGGLFNYVGALSGSVINNSGVEGLQYWFTIPQIYYIVFLGLLGIAIPVLFRMLKYAESAAMFFILLLFIYTSVVPLPDYFLWLYPIGVFLAITSKSKLSVTKKLLLSSLPTYVALFFINLIIGNGVQAGPFYFAYPIFHENIVFIPTLQAYHTWLVIFNLALLGSIIFTAIFCLARFNRVQMTAKSLNESALVTLHRLNLGVTRRKNVILAMAIVLTMLGGFAFNELYSQPIVVSDKQNFPLDLFPTYTAFDAAPMKLTYLIAASSVVFYNQSEPIMFQRSLNSQNLNISLTFNLQANHPGQYELLKTNNIALGINVTIGDYSNTSLAQTQVNKSFFLTNQSGTTIELPLNSSELDLTLLTTSENSILQFRNYSFTSATPNSISFGKFNDGNYGLTIRLNHMVLAEKTSGYYFVPVFFAVIIPFIVAVLSFPLLCKSCKTRK